MDYYETIGSFLRAIGVKKKLTQKGFCILKIEDYFGEEKLEVGPYQHNFFEVTFGSGHDVDCKVGSSVFKPLDDSLSFSSPSQISSWKINAFEEGSLGYMVLFQSEFFQNDFNEAALYRHFPFFNINTSPLLTISTKQRVTIVSLMEQLHHEASLPAGEQNVKVIRAYLTILLEKLNQQFKGIPSQIVFGNRAEEIAFQFESFLKVNASYQLRVTDLAGQFNISPSYFSEAIKKATGKTTKSIIKDYVILKAKSLLIQTSLPVSAIAFRLGFEETSNFTNYFKQYTGSTPKNYRRNLISYKKTVNNYN